MKKLSILLLSFLFINTSIINAQTETNKEQTSISEIKEECPTTKNKEGKLVCVKTGKECKTTCEKKATKSCCKGKKTKSTDKIKKGSFNFNKSNNYGEVKSSCSKAEKKACSKKKESEEKKNEDVKSSEE